LSWGGKGRNGGFSAGTGDRKAIKEVLRYNRVLAKLDAIGEFFRETCIENLDYQDAIRIYGRKLNCVLFCDPPYDQTEHYYSQSFGRADHVFLAHLLVTVPAPVVATYYDSPLIRELYPETEWRWERVCVTKNSALRQGNKPRTEEIILTKRTATKETP
jgi:site-specific DNA-adenine methylase